MAEARIVRDGEGEVYERHWRFKQGSLTGGRFDLMVGAIDYLSGPPLHVHRDQDDTFLVLEGNIAVQVGDEIHHLGPGDFATVPPGIPHTFDNIEKDQKPPRVCNVMTPGGLDAQFREVLELGGAADAERMAAIREKHGITVVGPTLGEKLGLG